MALTLILLIEKWKEHEDKKNVILFLLLYTFKYIYIWTEESRNWRNDILKVKEAINEYELVIH